MGTAVGKSERKSGDFGQRLKAFVKKEPLAEKHAGWNNSPSQAYPTKLAAANGFAGFPSSTFPSSGTQVKQENIPEWGKNLSLPEKERQVRAWKLEVAKRRAMMLQAMRKRQAVT